MESTNADQIVAAMFEQDSASQLLGIEISEVSAERAVLTMTVRPDMVNGLGVCHGGFLFTLADSAMAFVSNCENQRSFASNAGVDFINPAPIGARLTAACEPSIRRGKLTVHDVTITDDAGTSIALFRGRTLTVGGDVISGSNGATA